MRAFRAEFFNRDKHIEALSTWCRTQGIGWIYVSKLLIGITLAYWSSMYLQLSSTRSAALTVLVLMQPQTGQVLTKGLARIAGTIVGLAASLTFVALFHQHPPLFLLATSIWCGVCIAGAVRFRDFRAYLFLLSGYTVGMIGMPGAIHPEVAVSVAVSRMLAVSLGIVCSGLVSAVIMPQTTQAAFQGLLARRLIELCRHGSKLLDHQLDQNAYEQARLMLAAQAVNTAAIRQAASIENPRIRQHHRKLVALNLLFLDLSTRLHTLARTYFSLAKQYTSEQFPLKCFDDMASPLLNLLDTFQTDKQFSGKRVRQYIEPLKQVCTQTRSQIRKARQAMALDTEYQALSATVQQQIQDDFETLCELLFRFCDQLYNYCDVYADLEDERSPRWRIEFDSLRRHFRTSVNAMYVINCGVRSAAVILIISTLWYYSGWANGALFVETAIILATLSATAPNPHKMAVNLAQGAGIGYIIGFFITFFVMPRMDGFVLMMFCIAPVIIIGGRLSLNPKYAGLGIGGMINFCFVSSPLNPAVYNPHQFMNNSVAGLLGGIMTAILLSIMFPASVHWVSTSLIKDLRQLVSVAVTAPLNGLKNRLDAQCNDILNLTYNICSGQVLLQRSLMDWHSNVESICHAIIELRTIMENADPTENSEFLDLLKNKLGTGIVQLYHNPSAQQHAAAHACIEEAIRTLFPQLEPVSDLFSRSPKRQIMSYLHVIRMALDDPQGPFRIYLVTTQPQKDIVVEA